VALAKKLGNGEVINCDSVQIYQEIQIATAKPSDEEKAGVPHHLIDYVSPHIDYTAADWAEDASRKIREIEARQAIPILVGGTGFYLRSLRQPLFESPKTDQTLRSRLNSIREKKGALHLFKMLSRIDPVTAAKQYPRDYPRVQRALEVCFQTGQKFSELQPKRVAPPDFAKRIRIFALNPDRAALYELINSRAIRHFDNGIGVEFASVQEMMSVIQQNLRVS